jgi:hypothetical protein
MSLVTHRESLLLTLCLHSNTVVQSCFDSAFAFVHPYRAISHFSAWVPTLVRITRITRSTPG